MTYGLERTESMKRVENTKKMEGTRGMMERMKNKTERMRRFDRDEFSQASFVSDSLDINDLTSNTLESVLRVLFKGAVKCSPVFLQILVNKVGTRGGKCLQHSFVPLSSADCQPAFNQIGH